MKLLQSLLEAASKSDINTYYRQVKISLKADPKFKLGRVSRGTIASTIRDIAENDPDSAIDVGEVTKGVWDKYVADFKTPKQVAEDISSSEFTNTVKPEPTLSSKDRSFGGSDASEDDDYDEVDPEVEELKQLRVKDIGEVLTPEQKLELEELRSSGDEDSFGSVSKTPKIGMSSDTLKPIGEGKNSEGDTTYGTYARWKSKVKSVHPGSWLDGDADVANAMMGPKPYVRGQTFQVGYWDGVEGTVDAPKAKVTESCSNGLLAFLADKPKGSL